MKKFFVYLLVAASITGGATVGMAANLGTLKARFEARYAMLSELKKRGYVGETAEGFVAAVKPAYLQDARVASTIELENADRRTLYDLLGKNEGVSPEVVARRNAARNRTKAIPGEFFRDAAGVWQQVGGA